MASMIGEIPKTPRVCQKGTKKGQGERGPGSKVRFHTSKGHQTKKEHVSQLAYSTKIGLEYTKSSQPNYDEEYLENQAAEKMVEELMQYLKDHWKIYVDKKSSLIEIAFRTLDIMYHKNPANHWLIKRARQKISDYSGFFSNVREPYLPLGKPELDSAKLVFDNLPERLKIDSLEWFLELQRREDEEKRRNAPLPKLPREKISRPRFGKGRIRKGAGGTDVVDQFVKAAERFQKEIRGSLTFTKLLREWKASKEDEAANLGSPFGVLRNRIPVAELKRASELGVQISKNGMKKQRISSTIDDKIYQHQMLHLEKMMAAMYDILKSLLNIRSSQLESMHRLPAPVVMSLREHSPETKLHRKVIPKELLQRKPKYGKHRTSTMKNIANAESDGKQGRKRSSIDNSTLEKVKYYGTGRSLPISKLEEEDIHEILPLDDLCDRGERKENMKLIRTIIKSPSYLDDRPPLLKSTTLKKENPEETSKRNTRYDQRYRAFFDRKNLKTPIPQWHNVRLELQDSFKVARATVFDEHKKSVIALLEYGRQQGDNLPFTALRPNPDEITTPKLPNSQSVEVLSAEEMSRLNLLSKCPGADSEEPVPSDIQRLYYEAGTKTTNRDMYQTIMQMKKAFNDVDKNVRTYYLNEIDKFEWDTMKRFKTKIAAIEPEPVYEWSITTMRQAMSDPIEELDDLNEQGVKRQARWYKNLAMRLQEVHGLKHHGCVEMLKKLHKYSDVDTRSRPSMVNRLCLLVLSLPTTELGAPYFQEAILFLLDQMFGLPKQLLFQWLRERALPCLL